MEGVIGDENIRYDFKVFVGGVSKLDGGFGYGLFVFDIYIKVFDVKVFYFVCF